MTLQPAFAAFWSWIDTVASTIVYTCDKFHRPAPVRFVEEENGYFRLELPAGEKRPDVAGIRIRVADGRISPDGADVAASLRGRRAELVFCADRFIFRTLELPERAVEFLSDIMRAQIDRLTPWQAQDVAFGWTAPVAASPGRISMTVSATPRTSIAPYLSVLEDLGVQSTSVFAAPNTREAKSPIKVLDHKGPNVLDLKHLRSAMAAVLVICGLSSIVALSLDHFLGAEFQSQRQDIARQIAARRVLLLSGGPSVKPTAQQLLEQRKRETPSSVMVLEALSRILPDHTYVTELRIEGEKLQIIGVTRDAPSLIPLIEQSRQFTEATFFAPTTSSAGDVGERFHIEAKIRPSFGAGI